MDQTTTRRGHRRPVRPHQFERVGGMLAAHRLRGGTVVGHAAAAGGGSGPSRTRTAAVAARASRPGWPAHPRPVLLLGQAGSSEGAQRFDDVGDLVTKLSRAAPVVVDAAPAAVVPADDEDAGAEFLLEGTGQPSDEAAVVEP